VFNGAEKWQFETGGFVFSSPAVVDGIVTVGSGDSNVYALDAASGTEQWTYQMGDLVPIRSSPTIVDNTVYIGGSDNNVYALYAGELMREVDDTDESRNNTNGGSDLDNQTGQDGTNDVSSDDAGPGFGISGAVGGLSGAYYLLKRRSKYNSNEE
jgi:outer membrane protein assembly factor BamB